MDPQQQQQQASTEGAKERRLKFVETLLTSLGGMYEGYFKIMKEYDEFGESMEETVGEEPAAAASQTVQEKALLKKMERQLRAVGEYSRRLDIQLLTLNSCLYELAQAIDPNHSIKFWKMK